MFDAEHPSPGVPPPERRSALRLAAGAVLAMACSAAAWPLMRSNERAAPGPSRWRVDLRDIPSGGRVTLDWKRQKVFIHHRNREEMVAARVIDRRLQLREEDRTRVLNPAWLVVVGHCPYDGSRLLGHAAEEPRGLLAGWLCPRCGTSYDLSGRPRPGPVRRALEIPPYYFSGPLQIEIG